MRLHCSHVYNYVGLVSRNLLNNGNARTGNLASSVRIIVRKYRVFIVGDSHQIDVKTEIYNVCVSKPFAEVTSV